MYMVVSIGYTCKKERIALLLLIEHFFLASAGIIECAIWSMYG